MKIKKRIIKAFSYLFFFVLLVSGLYQVALQAPLKEQGFTDLDYQITRLPDHTFGYQILHKNKVFIDQPHIPGLPGKSGFKTKNRAARMARHVIGKIRQGEIPPSVSIAEMKKMKVLD